MLSFEENDTYTVKWKGEDLEQFREPLAQRLIFMHPDFVVKIDNSPTLKWASRQTAREIDFWETLRADKQHFAEILEFGRTPRGFWYIRQKRYEVDKGEVTQAHLETLCDLVFKYNIHDILEDVIDGNGNWMVSKGEVIIYDWGCWT